MGVEFSLSSQLFSMLIEQLINHREQRTENLKIRTDFQDQVMDCWSVTQWMIILVDRLLKKASNQILKLVLLLLLFYMAFKHCISFATDLAANFGCNQFRIMPDIVYWFFCTAI